MSSSQFPSFLLRGTDSESEGGLRLLNLEYSRIAVSLRSMVGGAQWFLGTVVENEELFDREFATKGMKEIIATVNQCKVYCFINLHKRKESISLRNACSDETL